MKNIITITAAMIAMCCNGQSIKIAEGELMRFEGGKIVEVIELGVEASMNKYINIGVDIEYFDLVEKTSNVLCYLSANVWEPGKATIQAKAGFGWGHFFTNAQTDHNFHTYNIAMPIKWEMCKNIAIFAEPAINCRTYAEHIGFAKDRSWWSISIGLDFKIGGN